MFWNGSVIKSRSSQGWWIGVLSIGWNGQGWMLVDVNRWLLGDIVVDNGGSRSGCWQYSTQFWLGLPVGLL